MTLQGVSAAAEHPVLSALLAALLALFVLGFVARGLWLLVQLGRARQRLLALGDAQAGEPDAVGAALSASPWLATAWAEYRKTLFLAGPPPALGGVGGPRWLATVGADALFNGPFVADPRVGAEFFKHLPGVFTGLGIIGTFFGLVQGLQQFRVSADAQEVRVSLEALMGAVGGAFTVSAVAIGLAIAVTLAEKLLLGALHGRVDRLAVELDRRFAAEPAERYLEATARHAAASAGQLAALAPLAALHALPAQLASLAEQNTRTAVRLTGTLQASLAQASERQIDASGEQLAAQTAALAQAMADTVGPAVARSMAEALSGPVARSLGESVSAAVSVAVSDALSRGLAQALDRALAAPLERVAQALQQSAHTEREASLRELGLALERFGERLQGLLEGQASGLQGLQARHGQALEAVAAQLARLPEQLQHGSLAGAQALQQRAGELMDGFGQRSGEQTSQLVSAVQALLRQSALSDERLQQTVAALSATSRSAIGGLGEGAQQVQAASRQFAAAAERAGVAMAQVGEWGGRLDQTGRQLAEAAAQLQQGVADYQIHREQVGRMTGELQALLAQARREASLSTEVLQRIESASRELGRSQRQAEDFLGGVAEVLGQAHEAFSQAMLRTVGRQNEAFQQQLGTAVGLLATTVAQLDDALGALTPPARSP